MVQKVFEKLIFKKIVLDRPQDTYFVFKNDKEYEEISAANAFDAYKKSNISMPLKIKNIKYLLYEHAIINEHLKSDDENNHNN